MYLHHHSYERLFARRTSLAPAIRFYKPLDTISCATWTIPLKTLFPVKIATKYFTTSADTQMFTRRNLLPNIRFHAPVDAIRTILPTTLSRDKIFPLYNPSLDEHCFPECSSADSLALSHEYYTNYSQRLILRLFSRQKKFCCTIICSTNTASQNIRPFGPLDTIPWIRHRQYLSTNFFSVFACDKIFPLNDFLLDEHCFSKRDPAHPLILFHGYHTTRTIPFDDLFPATKYSHYSTFSSTKHYSPKHNSAIPQILYERYSISTFSRNKTFPLYHSLPTNNASQNSVLQIP
jgi:hypothetical protein